MVYHHYPRIFTVEVATNGGILTIFSDAQRNHHIQLVESQVDITITIPILSQC